MVLPKPKYIELAPLWKRQNEDNKYLGLALPIAFYSYFLIYFSILFFLLGIAIEFILGTEFENSPLLIQYSTNFFFAMLLSGLFSLLMIISFLKLHPVFSNISILEEFYALREDIIDLLIIESDDDLSENEIYVKSRNGLISDLLIVLSYGFLAAIIQFPYYGFVYFILYVFVFLVGVYFLSAYVSSIVALFLISLVMAIWIVNTKTKIEESKKIEETYDPFVITDRIAEIMLSNEPPIICAGCRSYISSDSTVCKICGDNISKSSEE